MPPEIDFKFKLDLNIVRSETRSSLFLKIIFFEWSTNIYFLMTKVY